MEVNTELHARPLYPQRNRSRYPFDRRLGGPNSRSGLCGEEKNFLPLPGIQLRAIRSDRLCRAKLAYTCSGQVLAHLA
jgi:hypothetical protein